MCIAFLYALNRNWFTSMLQLAVLPFQNFAWQSEKYMANTLFRLSSFISLGTIAGIAICSYHLGVSQFKNYDTAHVLLWVIPTVLVISIIRYAANYFYFKIHNQSETANLVVDFQYSLNQWFALAIGILLLVDVFYFRLHSSLNGVALILTGIYFLVRLFGTILVLQNNFKYSILTVFVYLCTFEIVPALVTAKVLFVNS